jgi:hypothetical protein
MIYFLIGDEVYVPKHKMIGTITDKLYDVGNEEIMLRIYPKNELCNIAYGNSLTYDPMFVNYSTVRSLKTNELYQKKIEQTLPNIGDLNIPNLLKKKDIIKGTKIKVVDNYMLERMSSYTPGNYLYAKLVLSHLVERDGILTGKSMTLPNGILAVECKFDIGTYYIYQHSIQLIKKVNILKRIWNKVNKVDRRVWAVLFFLVTLSMLVISFVVMKQMAH